MARRPPTDAEVGEAVASACESHGFTPAGLAAWLIDMEAHPEAYASELERDQGVVDFLGERVTAAEAVAWVRGRLFPAPAAGRPDGRPRRARAAPGWPGGLPVALPIFCRWAAWDAWDLEEVERLLGEVGTDFDREDVARWLKHGRSQPRPDVPEGFGDIARGVVYGDE